MRKWWAWCQLGRCPGTRTLPTCPYSKLCLRRPCGKLLLPEHRVCAWGVSQEWAVGPGGLRFVGQRRDGSRGLGNQRGGVEGAGTLPLLGSTGRPAFSFPCSLYPVVPINSRVITEKEIEVGGFLFPKNVSGAGWLGFLGVPHGPKLMCCPFFL